MGSDVVLDHYGKPSATAFWTARGYVLKGGDGRQSTTGTGNTACGHLVWDDHLPWESETKHLRPSGKTPPLSLPTVI